MLKLQTEALQGSFQLKATQAGVVLFLKGPNNNSPSCRVSTRRDRWIARDRLVPRWEENIAFVVRVRVWTLNTSVCEKQTDRDKERQREGVGETDIWTEIKRDRETWTLDKNRESQTERDRWSQR